jgi:hypothetical protein
MLYWNRKDLSEKQKIRKCAKIFKGKHSNQNLHV